MNKRGQGVQGIFLGLFTTGLAFLVLVIAIALVAQILGAQQDTQITESISGVTNESVSGNASLANAGTPTLRRNIANGSALVHNSTAGIMVHGTDYSLTDDGIFLRFTLVSGGLVNISYNYTVFTETTQYNVSGSGLTGTENVGDLLPTMGLLAAVIALLSLLALLAVMFGPGMLERFT